MGETLRTKWRRLFDHLFDRPAPSSEEVPAEPPGDGLREAGGKHISGPEHTKHVAGPDSTKRRRNRSE